MSPPKSVKKSRSAGIYSIAPHAPFLSQLVAGVLDGPLLGDWPRDNPFWLADVTIILPTQRARHALSAAFAGALGGAALLPDIQTLAMDEGDARHFVDEDPDFELPKTISAMDRQFWLSKLIEQWAMQKAQSQQGDHSLLDTQPARILALAQSLGELIDELETEGVRADALRLVPQSELDPTRKADLAENFAQNLQFLEIALSTWPDILEELGQVDISRANTLRVENKIKALGSTYGNRPVIAAGSTGSVPSTARLLKAIAKLPRGCLVLPGLDTGLNSDTFKDLLRPENAPHGHPQYGLAQLLHRLGKTPGDVVELAPKDKTGRTRIVRHALALSKDTTHWSQIRAGFSTSQIKMATKDVSIIAARNEREQSLAIALAARQGLQNGKSVGIITPDRNFARRIAVDLKRFNITVDDSAGTPLFHTLTGRLVRQILSVGLNKFAPVDLMALLQNRQVLNKGNDKEKSATIHALEYGLFRGQRVMPGIQGLFQTLEKNLDGSLEYPALRLSREEGKRVSFLLKELETAFAPLVSLLQEQTFLARDLAGVLQQVLFGLMPEAEIEHHSLNGLAQFENWVKDLWRTGQAGPQLRASDAQSVLQTLMGTVSVRARVPARTDISIWGRLEARMQAADLMILCTLNEGVWPEIADPGPWLSRGMRLHAGLEPPERQHGLAAHDFELAISHGDVLLAYSKRMGTSPAIPSRLIERFMAFSGDAASRNMLERGDLWLDRARNLDKAKILFPAQRPAPCPKASLRPRALSVTEIEALITSPFDLYAKHVLKLRQVDPLGEDIGYRERGTLVHEVFARFVQAKHDPTHKDAHHILMEIARDVFSAMQGQSEQRDIWLKRLEKSMHGFLEYERARNSTIATRFAEQKMRWTFEIEGEEFTLHGKADRIDIRHDGMLEILDYKTGTVPGTTQMKEFMAPQLLVEAAIAKASGFEANAPAPTCFLEYIKIGAGPDAFVPCQFHYPRGMDVMQAADKIMINIKAQISAFLLNDHLAMMPRLMPTKKNYAGPYEHLARTTEWTQIEGDEE
ncbi:MAG TPA: double-strand break repair protein AddB [Devosia sp.]|nr:double-strand break repair protein AddB [Devosia sp.]